MSWNKGDLGALREFPGGTVGALWGHCGGTVVALCRGADFSCIAASGRIEESRSWGRARQKGR